MCLLMFYSCTIRPEKVFYRQFKQCYNDSKKYYLKTFSQYV